MDAAARRRSERRRPGWLSTLAGALLLVGVGFGVGLVAGTAFEEPDLVWDHLAGRSQEAPLAGGAEGPAAATAQAAEPVAEPPPSLPGPERRTRPLGAPRAAGAPAAERPAVATAPPAAAAPAAAATAPTSTPPAPPAPAPRAAAPPAPAPRAAATAPAVGGFAVQVGAFGERSGADRLVASLRAKGFAASVAREPGGAAPFKVRVGPVPSRPEADALAGRLKREERVPTWVLALDAR